MRKLAFFTVIMALCAADFGAFGAGRATATGNRRGAQSTTQTEAMTEEPTQSSAVTARVATTRKNVARAAVAPKVNTLKPAVQSAEQRPAVTARAATKQKVINLGTKVESATANTVVSEECQNAYYGCMDAFCMLDNASGGRCQCSDRNAELDVVLEEIMKLDEQSLAMATEGVERLQMGENAEEIMARAKAAADSVTGKATSGSSASTSATGSKTVRKLDLSAWKSGSLFDDDIDFDDSSLFAVAESTLADKTGDALQSEAAKLCVAQMPDQCKSATSFLQLTYAQKIKSDCSAYENSLKQQRSASAEKLQTAQKALRDTALEMYQNENKYDFGQCVVQFKSCMQTTGECGEDFSGCVADTSILGQLYNKSGNGAKAVATTVIKTGSTSVTISSASYDILNTKKIMCESVTKQCVNANKKNAVWNQVIKDLAPVIYTAEYNAASNSRMNCINTAVSCVQTVCGSQWDDQSDNYDACLSDPSLVAASCKLELNKCNGGGDTTTQDRVWEYVKAKLAALKVDKCTLEVKQCLTAEDNCGSDYANCIGLDTDSIVDMCYEDKLIACSSKYDSNSVREYIAQVAQGIALNIDNKFATTCQNSVDAAFERVCGITSDDDEDAATCPNLVIENRSLKDVIKVQFLYDNKYYDSVSDYMRYSGLEYAQPANGDASVFRSILSLKPEIRGEIMVDAIEFNNSEGGNIFGLNEEISNTLENTANYNDGAMTKLMTEMSAAYSSIMDQVESDSAVKNCREGRTLQGISTRTRGDNDATKATTLGRSEGRFEHLTDNMRYRVAGQIISSVISDYGAEYEKARTKLVDAYDEIKKAYSEKVDMVDAELDAVNAEQCKAYKVTADFSRREGHRNTLKKDPSYNSETNVCVIKTTEYYCNNYRACNVVRQVFSPRRCGCVKTEIAKDGWQARSTTTENKQMQKVTK